MDCLTEYLSPLGIITLTGNGQALTGLGFRDSGPPPCRRGEELPLFGQVRRWLDLYFSGKEPDFTPPVFLRGTAFQQRVWTALLTIPYGQRVTYGALAERLGSQARAVGGAVGRNPVLLVVPCHRLVGAGGALTGYRGGLERKAKLLALEGNSLSKPPIQG